MNFGMRTGAGKTVHNSKDSAGNGHSSGPAPEQTEDAQWRSLLSDEQLPEDFTARFMEELESIEIEAPERSDSNNGNEQHEIPKKSTVRPSRRSVSIGKHRKKSQFWTAAALILLLAGGTLLYTQPTIADQIRSLFSSDMQLYPDTGMKSAKDAGLVQDPHVQVEDQGYTIAVNEIIADSNRFVVGLTITDKNGDPFRGSAQPHFRVTDSYYAEIPTWSGEVVEGSTSKYNLHFTRPVLTQTLKIDAEIDTLDKMDNTGATSKTIRGNWNFSIDVDLSEAASQTLQTPIGESYTTPQGLTVHMLGATRTPSGGSLEYETSLEPTDKAANGKASYHKIDYHLENEKGEMLNGSDTKDQPDHPFEFSRWTNRAHWFQVLDDFAYDKQKTRFVLDSYIIREKSDASVSFDPSVLSPEHPAEFKDSGDELTFRRFELGRNPSIPLDDTQQPETLKKAGIIEVVGTTNNFVANDKWIAEDGKGHTYDVTYSVSLGIGENEPLQGDFIVIGLSEIPEKLTLRRTMVNHVYRDANWSFVLPQTGVPASLSE